MQWDLGLQGIAVLAGMALVFGIFTQVVFWSRASLWLGAAAAVASFVAGLLVSEVFFGWATEADLQPNIDGLSFDEVLLTFVVGAALVVVARYLTRTGGHGPITLAR